MGTQSVRWAVGVGKQLNLSPTDRSILVYLAHCRNDRSGQCNPSRATIVAETGWGDRAVRRALTQFEEKALIERSAGGDSFILQVTTDLDSQSNDPGLTVQDSGLTVQRLDSESTDLDSQSNALYRRKEHQENTKGTAAQKRGTRIPDRFIVTSDMWSWAGERTPLVDVHTSTEMFVNHFRAKTGRDATKHDWPATWRNWLLKDQQTAERAPHRKSPPAERVHAILALGSDTKALSA